MERKIVHLLRNPFDTLLRVLALASGKDDARANRGWTDLDLKFERRNASVVQRVRPKICTKQARFPATPSNAVPPIPVPSSPRRTVLIRPVA
jgi:hypothetical protein